MRDDLPTSGRITSWYSSHVRPTALKAPIYESVTHSLSSVPAGNGHSKSVQWFISVLAASTMGRRSSLTTFILRDRGSFLFPCAAGAFAALLEVMNDKGGLKGRRFSGVPVS